MKLYTDKLIVVTGGAGFIGSCVIRELNSRGFSNIVVVDELGNDERWKNLLGKQFFEVVHKDAFFTWVQGRESDLEAIIHLGACSSTTERDADYLLENNYRYSIKIAELAFKYNLRFIYASSAATYGNGELGFFDDLDGLRFLKPMNMYGYSKHLFDLWLYNQKLLKNCVGLKYFNVFGPNEYHKGRMASALMHFLRQFQETKTVRLFASECPNDFPDGEQSRDFIYVKDAVRMTCAFLETEHNGIFNIASGKATTWNTLAKALFQALGLPCSITYVPMPDDLKGIYQNYTCASMEKTHKALGTLSETLPIEESVRDYIQNYLISGARW